MEAFRFFKNRWTVEGEPKTDEQQRGFIGELIALMWVIQNKGEEHIRYWDASGHAANDIEAPEFHVEAKAKTPTAQKVQISFQEQLQLPDNKELYLAVTNVRLNHDSGLTLPEIRDNVLAGLEDSGVSTESLKTKIESAFCLQSKISSLLNSLSGSPQSIQYLPRTGVQNTQIGLPLQAWRL